MEEEKDINTEEVVETTNPKKDPKGDKKGINKKLICILVAIIVLLAGATCYFAFVRGNDDKKNTKDKDSDKKEIINYD